MVKLIVGKKGTGKTKQLLDSVNNAVQTNNGHVVFINSGNRHIIEIDHNVRLIDISPFSIDSYRSLYGFICGIISGDYDISNIFIDSINKITASDELINLESFLKCLKTIGSEYNITFTLTMSLEDETPEYIKEYA